MNIFHLHTERAPDGASDSCTWLVIADTLFDAVSLIPAGYLVRAADVQLAGTPGPSRVIGCFDRPTLH